jgi:hypothetical protein
MFRKERGAAKEAGFPLPRITKFRERFQKNLRSNQVNQGTVPEKPTIESGNSGNRPRKTYDRIR